MPKITAAQFFVMLFLCRAFTFFTLSPGASRGVSDTSAVVSLALAGAGGLLLLAPGWLLLRKREGVGIVEYAFQKSTAAGTAAAGFFALFALYEAVEGSARFAMFITSAIYPGEGAFIFVVLFTLTAMYLVWMGLEATARLSGFVLWALIFSVALIALTLLPDVKTVNLSSPFLEGMEPVLRGAGATLGETAELALVLLFVPYVRGNMRRGVLWWTAAVLAVLGGLSLLTVATVGEYAVTQAYPMAAVAKMARLFYFQRLDALHMVVWTMVGVVKTALFLYIARQCLFAVLPQRAQKAVLPVCGGAVIAAALALAYSYRAYEAVQAVTLSGVPLALAALAVPLILAALPRTAPRGPSNADETSAPDEASAPDGGKEERS